MPGENRLLEALTSYLSGRGKLPAFSDQVKPGENGAFDYTAGPSGTLFLRPGAPASTRNHEMAHAAHFELARQAQNPSSSPQFREAFSKLFGQGNIQDSASRLGERDPTVTPEQAAYRQNPMEAVAFGAGNQAPGVQERDLWRGGGHLDSSMATQLAILLELAQRGKK